jgi:HPt (histidine-containing phosphotransfer) domain-containing protein
MEQLSATAQADRELEQAQRDLRETLEQVDHEVEQLEARLRPQAIMRSHPIALPLLAGLLGFSVGSDRQTRPLRWVAIGALLWVALAAAHRGSNDGRNRTSK